MRHPSEKETYSLACGEFVASLVLYPAGDGNVLAVIGGDAADGTICAELFSYSPRMDTWTEHFASGSLTKHSRHAAVSLRGAIYIVAGIREDTSGVIERTADVFVHTADLPLQPPAATSSTPTSLELTWSLPAQYATEVGACSGSDSATVLDRYETKPTVRRPNTKNATAQLVSENAYMSDMLNSISHRLLLEMILRRIAILENRLIICRHRETCQRV